MIKLIGERNYPMVIAGLIGLWLNQKKKSAEVFRSQLRFVQAALRESIDTGGELIFLSVLNTPLSLNFKPTSEGYILEMVFEKHADADNFFSETVGPFKDFNRAEIVETFGDDELHMLFALLINQAPIKLDTGKIVFELPSPHGFFNGVNTRTLIAEDTPTMQI